MGALPVEQESVLSYVQHQYGDHDLQRFGVWERPGPFETSLDYYWVVFVHGGAWRDPRNTFRDFIPSVNYMQSSSDPNFVLVRGFISIDYRLSPNPEFPQEPESTPTQSFRAARYPDHLQDVCRALSAAQKLYNFRNNYIYIGHSSGATMGFQLLMGENLVPNPKLPAQIHFPATIISLYGIYDIAGLNSRYGGEYSDFLEGAYGPDQDVWRQLSPGLFKENLTAAFDGAVSSPNSFHVILADSADDKLLDPVEVETMRMKLVKDGVNVSVVDNLVGDHDYIWKNPAQLAQLVSQCIKVVNATN